MNDSKKITIIDVVTSLHPLAITEDATDADIQLIIDKCYEYAKAIDVPEIFKKHTELVLAINILVDIYSRSDITFDKYTSIINSCITNLTRKIKNTDFSD